jgi:mono/diheme cytochrome c family protein
LAIGLAVLTVVLGATGCGSEEADLVNGKNLYAESCQRCHALERAGGGANVGPDLDEAFAYAREDGLGEQTVEGVVLGQIGNVRRNSTMPEDLVTGDDARDVAAYVAAVAGQPGEDSGALAEAGAKVSSKPIVAEGGMLEIPADPSGALAFASTKAQAKPGTVEVVMPNEASVQHNIALRDEGGELVQEGEVVGQGGTSMFTAMLKPGAFKYVCTVPGHEEGGMTGELTVK